MFTHHAVIRSHQRAIPPLIVDMLMQHGAVVRDNHGAELRFFDKKAWKSINYLAGPHLSSILREKYKDAYAVIADGTIITVQHRYKRIKRY